MVRAGTGSGLIHGPGHGLDLGMNLGDGRNLSMGQDDDGFGDWTVAGLSRVQDSDGL